MKVLEEALLLNNLEETLKQVDEHEEVLIKRNEETAVMLLTLEKYNEMKAAIYKANNS